MSEREEYDEQAMLDSLNDMYENHQNYADFEVRDAVYAMAGPLNVNELRVLAKAFGTHQHPDTRVKAIQLIMAKILDRKKSFYRCQFRPEYDREAWLRGENGTSRRGISGYEK